MPKSFQERVYDVVRTIPQGKVLTYKEVAVRMGNPSACRAVGNALNRNRDKNVPCHRVIRSDGKTGGYFAGEKRKQEILKQEKYLK